MEITAGEMVACSSIPAHKEKPVNGICLCTELGHVCATTINDFPVISECKVSFL